MSKVSSSDDGASKGEGRKPLLVGLSHDAQGRPCLKKDPTGIDGFDKITEGGLPAGRTTLVCGDAGCGKTLFALEFLVRGVTRFGEPGVFIAFEETRGELTANVASLGFNLDRLVAEGKLLIDYIYLERSEIEESGAFDLDGLFVRLGHAIDSIGAKRVVLDTMEVLFASLPNEVILRAEMRRLFRWMKEKDVTAVVTAEKGQGTLTRHGLEEYVSDCVVTLDHRVVDQVSTRWLRVVKYRGSTHDTNEFPFLIDEGGLSVLPLSSLGLDHDSHTERVTTGIPDLDEMLGGSGFFRGSTVLITGMAGTGKTSMAAHFTRSICERGARCLYLAFEESRAQIVRNMRSIGIDLEPWVNQGLLRVEATRPTLYGLERHLVKIHRQVLEFQPDSVIVDPISNFATVGSTGDSRSMLLRLMDFLKGRGITVYMTNLSHNGNLNSENTDLYISSLVDTWLLLRTFEGDGERNRGLFILKSRGMAHSNQVREFLLTNRGVELAPVTLGPNGVLTGAARLAHRDKAVADSQTQLEEEERRRIAVALRRAAMESQITALRADLEAEEAEEERMAKLERSRGDALARDWIGKEMARMNSSTLTKPKSTQWQAPGGQEMKSLESEGLDLEPAAETPMELRLYVAGQTVKSLAAIANLRQICQEHLTVQYVIEVIDLLETPQLARGDQIVAIPTLVRKLPTPIRKIIGDLSNTERVLVGLDLRPHQRKEK